MDLSKMVDERLVKFDMDASSKEDAIRKVAALMYTNWNAYRNSTL